MDLVDYLRQITAIRESSDAASANDRKVMLDTVKKTLIDVAKLSDDLHKPKVAENPAQSVVNIGQDGKEKPLSADDLNEKDSEYQVYQTKLADLIRDAVEETNANISDPADQIDYEQVYDALVSQFAFSAGENYEIDDELVKKIYDSGLYVSLLDQFEEVIPDQKIDDLLVSPFPALSSKLVNRAQKVLNQNKKEKETVQEQPQNNAGSPDRETDMKLCGEKITTILKEFDLTNEESAREAFMLICAMLQLERGQNTLITNFDLQEEMGGAFPNAAKFLFDLEKDGHVPEGSFALLRQGANGTYADASVLGYAAREKYYGDSAEELNQKLHAAMRDSKTILNWFASNLTANKYEQLLNNVLDGKITLYGVENFSGTMDRSPKCVAAVSSYIDNLLSDEHYAEFNRDELTPDAVRNICNSAVEDTRFLSECKERFNSQIALHVLDESEIANMRTFTGKKNVESVDISTFIHKNSEKMELANEAIATYASLEKFHNDHTFGYRFFHPIKFFRESRELSRMKDVFIKGFKMTEQELSQKKTELAARSTDPINLQYIKKTDPAAYEQIVSREKDHKDRNMTLVEHFASFVKTNGSIEKTDVRLMSKEEYDIYRENKDRRLREEYEKENPLENWKNPDGSIDREGRDAFIDERISEDKKPDLFDRGEIEVEENNEELSQEISETLQNEEKSNTQPIVPSNPETVNVQNKEPVVGGSGQ